MGGRLGLFAAFFALLLVLPGKAPIKAYELEPFLRDGRAILLLEGEISYQEEGKFLDHAAKFRIDELWLNSGGGNVDAAYKIAKRVRDLKLLTRIPEGGICASACVDILLAGVIRFVEEDFSVGIHPGSAFRSEKLQDSVIEEIQEEGREGAIDVIVESEGRGSVMTSEWIRHVISMGASMGLVDLANSVDARCMIFLSRDEMLRFNIVNTAPRPTSKYEGPLCKQIICDPDEVHPCLQQ